MKDLVLKIEGVIPTQKCLSLSVLSKKYGLIAFKNFNGNMDELKEFYLNQLNEILLDESNHDHIKFLSSVNQLLISDENKERSVDLKSSKTSQSNEKLFNLMNELNDLVQSDASNRVSVVKVIQGTNLIALMWVLHILSESRLRIMIANAVIEIPQLIEV